MFQLCYGSNTTVINVSSVLITYDKELCKHNFVFFKSDSDWYQMFIDENVLFITPVSNENFFEENLEDLAQIKEIEIKFFECLKTVISYSKNKIILKTEKYPISLNIRDDEIILFSEIHYNENLRFRAK